MKDKIDMPKLSKMQQELMERVPHGVRLDVYPKMIVAVRLIDALLQYLGSLGHKPWRPEPLDEDIQERLFKEVLEAANTLGYSSEYAAHWIDSKGLFTFETRNMIAALGVIEETVEYLHALSGSNRAFQKEELTDILFFYLELKVMSGFSWAEVEEEYIRKWKVNIERYRRGSEGDYDWDKRREGSL